ncbi:putative reverse transcriptase domain-containing protein [Tanacetum coccineum]
MPNKPKELVNKPTGTLLILSQFEGELEVGDELHRGVHDNLVRGNTKYKQDADQVDFEVGDFVLAVLTKDRFSIGEYNKLSAKKIGPLEIVEKINSNAYRLKLPGHIRCSEVFNVKHLLPYHGDSSDDDLIVNSRANFVYPGGMMQAQVLKNGPIFGIRAEVPIKMPPRRNRPLTKAYEQEFEQRVMARMEERLDHRGSKGEESENPFFDGNGSSSDEQPDQPRRNQREDNRRWESGMRVNNLEFDGDTLNPEGFIDWLVVVEEVFEFKEETDDQLVSHYIGGLRVQIMDSVNMFDPVTFSDAYQCALAFEKQSRRVGSSSSPAITRGGSCSSNVASHFVPNQAKPGGGSGLKCFNCGETGHRQSECKKASVGSLDHSID